MKIKDSILLITGGTGSFGNAVLKKFLNTSHFREIRIFSRDEKNRMICVKNIQMIKLSFI